MPNQKINLKKDVSCFLDALNHPFRKEIELLRNIILSANKGLSENIKWNGPNYCFKNEDRITMRVQPLINQVQIIFHRGAKKQEQPIENLISHNSKLFIWKENDRAVATFKNLETIEENKANLIEFVEKWIIATK